MNTKTVLYNLFAQTRVTTLARTIRKPGLSILMFHGLTENASAGQEDANHLNLEVSVFSSLCAWLKSHAHVLSLPEVLRLQREGRPLPKSSVVITFDDGYASNYHLAYPVLRQFDLPATIFAATDFVQNGAWLWPDRLDYAIAHSPLSTLDIMVHGTRLTLPLQTRTQRLACNQRLGHVLRNIPQELLDSEMTGVETHLEARLSDATRAPEIYKPMSWGQAREMVASGLVSIGSHTHRHLILSRCRPDTLHTELETSTHLITREIGTRPTLFAYPNGKFGDYNAATRDALNAYGYECSLTTETGFNPLAGFFNPHGLRRFGQPTCSAHLEVLVSGVLPLMASLLRKAHAKAAI